MKKLAAFTVAAIAILCIASVLLAALLYWVLHGVGQL
jgi:hypothetical protein